MRVLPWVVGDSEGTDILDDGFLVGHENIYLCHLVIMLNSTIVPVPCVTRYIRELLCLK